MTGRECVRQAMSLLNYTDHTGGVPGGEGVYRHALAYLNQIAAEVWYQEQTAAFSPLKTPADPLPFPDSVARTVLPYGVAMLLAQAEGDADQQTVFASLYDQRRAAARSAGVRIVDRLPEVSG